MTAEVSLTADPVTLAYDAEGLLVLLVERANPPFAGRLALPGGYLEPGETFAEAALRELQEETGVVGERAEQLGVWDAPNRDPRGRVVSVAHLVLVQRDAAEPRAASDARAATWVAVRRARQLAFDHDEMLRAALARLRARAEQVLVGAELLPPRFSLSELQALQEAALGQRLDKRNFRRRALDSGLLVPLDEQEQGVPHRRARLFRFDRRRTRYLA